MSHLVALEEIKRPDYELKIWYSLLVQAKALGIPSNDLVEFVGTLIPKMLECPSNYKTLGASKKDMWVFRGFYPKSSLFIKVSILKTNDTDSPYYIVKVRPIDAKMSYNARKKDRTVDVDASKLKQYMDNNLENHLLGTQHKLPNLIDQKVMMPRCLSPKGLPLFRYYKSTRKKNDIQ